MSLENTTTAAPAPETDVSDAPYSSADAIEELTNFYALGDDGNQEPLEEEVAEPDNSAETEEVSAEPDTETETEKPDAEKEPDKSEKPEETEKTDDEITVDDLGESDFEALEDTPTEPEQLKDENYPDAAKLNELYPRQKKELIQTAAEAIAAKRERDELMISIGGKDFVQPAVKIAKGVRESDPQSLFEGIVEIASSEGLKDVTGHSTFLHLIKANEWANQTELPELAELGKTMLEQNDRLLETRFGEGITAAKIEELAQIEKLGILDAWKRWKEQEFVDSDEFYELIAASEAPDKFISLREKQKATEAELEKVRNELGQKEAQKVSAAARQFAETGNKHIEKSLTGVVWAKSVLKEIPSDTPELKEAKAEFRQILIDTATQKFRASDSFKELSEAFARGDADTLKFREKFTKAINAVLLEIKPKNAIYERTVAALYGKTRNAQIAKKAASASASKSGEVLTPTETSEASVDKKPLTQDEIIDRMAKEIAALG